MTKLEVACVIIGFIGMVSMAMYCRIKIDDWKEGIVLLLIVTMRTVPFLLMVLLPLYFRLWRK